ncbi:DUF4433 domain-containing protein [Chryseotalea sanaruensis]|uniref:DUF4433 domain-containing protein n=1 Tax=Chryseotalea sanaruensis TaxID=2482724 RepID=A0A401U8R7_9BACT|nr:DUF4433 domain-containing protein [Chryseotalea sanaruensis]GCC51274.1 DUF4433 domain-containing protein [Chryseotalea sanaruensis]
MPGKSPNIIRLYRIIHINNLRHLLANGICTKSHNLADPNYIDIGDRGLINKRNVYAVGIDPPGGNLGDYVPFYFGRLSPMLLNIKTGQRDVTKRHQREIIYICCRLSDVVAQCEEWCFTDGHAKTVSLTEFYNDLKDLDEVDWSIVDERYWRNDVNDIDRVRRKQAEFLVKDYAPVDCVEQIIVYDASALAKAQEIVEDLELQIQVKVNPGNNYYYY